MAGPLHISMSRVKVTLEVIENFYECYGDDLDSWAEEARCANCQQSLEVGDFVDGKFPWEDTFNVCAKCKATYSLAQAKLERACSSLADHLQAIGVVASIGHDNSETLYVYACFKRDLKRVPEKWEGFSVAASYTGRISPATDTSD